MADGIGNITMAKGRGTRWEYTGDMKQARYYTRELSVEEISELAMAPAHRECLSWDTIHDDSTWKDSSGRSCWDFFAAQQVASAECSVDAQRNCPVVCEQKCYSSQVELPKPQHLMPRFPTPSSRVCLRSGLTADKILARCRSLSVTDRQKEAEGHGMPWAVTFGVSSADMVQQEGRMCARMQKFLEGAETCPLDLEEFQRSWNSGED